MRQLIGLLCSISFLLCTFSVSAAHLAKAATEPTKIHSITIVRYNAEYYQAQAKAWQKSLEKNSTHAEGWYNYHMAARYANMLSETETFDLEAISDAADASMPQSWVAPYLRYVNKGRTPDQYPNLLEAYRRAPEQDEVWQAMITYYASEGQTLAFQELTTKWFNSGTFSPGFLQWGYNALQSVETNGILITWGDNDTYACWLLQQAKKVRSDVQIINASLFTQLPNYRRRMLRMAGVQPVDSLALTQEGWEGQFHFLMERLAAQTNRPIYFCIAAPKSIRSYYSDQLHIAGLAYRYDALGYDAFPELQFNVEQKFLTDRLWTDLEPELSAHLLNRINVNYVPALQTLIEHYQSNGDTVKAAHWTKLSTLILERAGQQPIRENTNSTTNSKKVVSSINIRELQKKLVHLQGKLWIGNGEISNSDYEQFLLDLVKNRQFEVLETAQPLPTDWDALLPANLLTEVSAEKRYARNPSNGNHPIQNISYDGAVAYCDWITKVYNQSTDRKKWHARVVFRLPTKQEWLAAAQNGDSTIIYPWKGRNFTNAKGCYLANFNSLDQTPCDKMGSDNDGGYFTVPVDAYFPNDSGCYNLSGNVAEMLATKGQAIGGGWLDTPQNCTLQSESTFDGASPNIGFRVIMEVLP